MAAKAWNTHQKAVDEVFFQNEAVSLCLLINRRAKTMRVVDFRAGPTHAKRLFVMSLAQREGMEKVYTLVERDEVSTWVKLGFLKEGSIPGFYKRSDAFLLGATVPRAGARARHEREAAPAQSEMRIVARAQASAEDSGAAKAEAPTSPAQERMERTVVLGKKYAKDLAERALPQVKLAIVREGDVKKAVDKAVRSGKALTAFEPFGRDVERRYFSATTRAGMDLIASVESQACFGNGFLELLTSPRTDAEKFGTASALRAMCEKLQGEGIVSCFSLAPSDDVALAGAFLFNGFRRTGLLLNHLIVGGTRKDAIVWSRKLANPSED